MQTSAQSRFDRNHYLSEHLVSFGDRQIKRKRQKMFFSIEMVLRKNKNIPNPVGKLPSEFRKDRTEELEEGLEPVMEKLAKKITHYSLIDFFQIEKIKADWNGNEIKLYDKETGDEMQPKQRPIRKKCEIRIWIREVPQSAAHGKDNFLEILKPIGKEIASNGSFACPYKNMGILGIFLRMEETEGLIARRLFQPPVGILSIQA